MIIDLLTEIVTLGGRNTEKDLFGKSGSYKTVMSSIGKLEVCPECGLSKLKETYLGASIYTCPKCQKYSSHNKGIY